MNEYAHYHSRLICCCPAITTAAEGQVGLDDAVGDAAGGVGRDGLVLELADGEDGANSFEACPGGASF